MGYQEKQKIVTMASSILITGIYGWIVYRKHLQGVFDLSDDMRQWGMLLLIFIGITIAAHIVIQIIFHIINYIATREEDIPVRDERDKFISLKATRNAYYVFASGFVLAVLSQILGMPRHTIFLVFIASGLLAEIVDNGSQIYYYRKGI